MHWFNKNSDWSNTPSDWYGEFSVSQNTSTGHTDISVGGATTPVPSVVEFNELVQDTRGNIILDWYHGGLISGAYSSNNIRVSTNPEFTMKGNVRVICGGDVKLAYYGKYVAGKSPLSPDLSSGDYEEISFSGTDRTIPYDEDYPNIVIVFSRNSDDTSDITPEEVKSNVKIIDLTSLDARTTSVENAINDKKTVPIPNSADLITSGGVEAALYHQHYSKSVLTTASSGTRIVLREFNYGNKVAIRLVSNTAQFDSGVKIVANVRKTDNTYIEKFLSSDWVVFEDSALQFNRIYVHINGAIAQSGTIQIELVFGDAFDAVIKDSMPVENSTKSIESSAVFNIEKYQKEWNKLVDEKDGINYTINNVSINNTGINQNFGFVLPKGETLEILLLDPVGLIPANLDLYVYGYDASDNEVFHSYYLKKDVEKTFVLTGNLAKVRLYSNSSSLSIGNAIFIIKQKGLLTLNEMAMDLKYRDLFFFGEETISRAYAQNESFSLVNTKRFDTVIPKDTRFSVMYSDDDSIIPSTGSDIYMYLLYDKYSISSRSAAIRISQTSYVDIIAEKQVYGFGFYVIDSGNNVVSAQANGNIVFNILCKYSIPKLANAVISNGYDERLIVPAYYFDNNYLQNKIKRIKDICANSDVNGDNFVFATDIHWNYNAQHSVGLMKYLFENGALFSKLYLGGDLIQFVSEPNASGYATKEIFSDWIDYVNILNKGIKTPVELAVGNHEYLTLNYLTQGLFSDIKFINWTNYLHFQNKDFGNGNTERKYYYIDNVDKKIRYIFLASYDQGDETTISSGLYRMIAKNGYENEQNIWLRDVALNVNSGYKIVIFTHNLCTVSYTHFQNDQTFEIYGNATNIARTLLEYNGNGEIVAVINGHVHRDAIYIINDNSISDVSSGKQIPEIITTCDANDFPVESETLYDRESGTIKEQAFDFVNLDTEKKLIRFIRIGSPANNVGNYYGSLEERNVVYQQYSIAVAGNVTLSPFDLTGTKSWESDNESVATVNNGVVTGVSAGYARITLTTSDNQSVIYMIKVE